MTNYIRHFKQMMNVIRHFKQLFNLILCVNLLTQITITLILYLHAL